MRVISTIGLSFILATIALAAEPKDHKAASGKTVAVAHPPAATVDDTSISMAEIDAVAEPRLVRIRADEFAIKRRILEERVQDLLFQHEAQRRKTSMDDLLKEEIDAKVKPVTTEEARAVYESGRDRMGSMPEDEALAQIRTSMLKQRAAQRRAQFVDELRRNHDVQVFLDPPRIRMRAANGPSRGPESAPVTLVEFTDFQCPFCSRAAPTLRAVEEKFGQNIRLVFKHYPLPMHKEANRAAEAAVCADEQGRFWEMHDKLFTDPNRLSPMDIAHYARDVNIDLNQFNDCLASGRAAERVKRDRAEGDEYGVANTPTFFVNGRFLLGAVPLGTLASVIDEELVRSSSTTARK